MKRIMNPTHVLLLACASITLPMQAQQNTPSQNGAYYSAQRPWMPPLPFHPFPELPAVEVEPERYVYDDTLVNYDLLQANSLTSGPPVPGGGSGGQPGSRPFLPPVTAKVQLDARGALLTWNSKISAAYRVDYVPYMNAGTNELEWFTLVDGYPSHGTNTIWRDSGYWSLVTKPGTDPTRFYRVAEISNLLARPTVTISVANGTLSALTAIGVSVTPEDSCLGAKLWVDGEFWDEIDGSGEIVLDTGYFPNGSHTIYVTATIQAGGGESTDVQVTNRNVQFGYAISAKVTRTFENTAASQAFSLANRPQQVPNPITFGIMFSGSRGHPSWSQFGTNPDGSPKVNWDSPTSGNPIAGGRVILNGEVQNPDGLPMPRPYGQIKSLWSIADGILVGLGRVGHQPKFFLGDSDLWKSNYIRWEVFGGHNKFNTVNFGFLLGHGARGLSLDYSTGLPPVKDTYFPIWKPGTDFYDWVRLTECSFGSDNLRWMAILSCNNLYPDNYLDMWNKGRLPVGEKLHLLLGTSTTVYMVSSFGRIFGDQLARGSTIPGAWYHAGRATQHIGTTHPGVPVVFRVVGYDDCMSDTIYNWADPDPIFGIVDEEEQVYP